MKHRDKSCSPLLGAHMSIAGGVANALLLGKSVDCAAIQIFTRSARQWAAKPYTQEEVEQFHRNRKKTGIGTVIAHDSYLLNLASPDGALRNRSVAAFVDEFERCETLGVTHLIAHPGAHAGAGELAGIKTIARSLDEVHQACPGYKTEITLEITAGQGSNLGCRFEQIANIIDATKENDRLRVCFDTEHAFAAGYDLRTPEGYERTFTEFDEIIGVERIAAFHLNDSKKEFNSRVDRHEHIGKGFIGVEAFRMLVNDRRFWGLPMCLETPKGPDLKEDRENLALLRSLLANDHDRAAPPRPMGAIKRSPLPEKSTAR